MKSKEKTSFPSSPFTPVSTFSRFLLSLLLLLSGASSLFAQNNAVDFCTLVPEGLFDAGTSMETPIVVQNFDDIVGFQFTVEYDPELVEIETVVGSGVTPTSNIIEPGLLRIVWFDVLAEGVTIPDEGIAFNIRLLTLAQVENLEMNIINSTIPTEVTSSVGEILPFSACGTLLDAGGQQEFFTSFCSPIVETPLADGEMGTTQVVARGFDQVTGFEILLEYSPEAYQIGDVNAVAALSNGNFFADVSEPGLVQIIWNSNEGGITLPDDSPLLDVNLTAIGDQPFISLDVSDLEGSIEVNNALGLPNPTAACGVTINPGFGVVDFCPAFPNGPFTAGQEVQVGIVVHNFVDVAFGSLPIGFDPSFVEMSVDPVLNETGQDIGMTWSTNPGAVELLFIDWAGNASLNNGFELITLTFTVLEDVATLPVSIDPAAGSFQVTSDLELQNNLPATICDLFVPGTLTANVNAGISIGEFCQPDDMAAFLPGWTLTLTKDDDFFSVSGVTGSTGRINLSLPSGTYTQSWTPPGDASLWDLCSNTETITIGPGGEDGSVFLNAATGVERECNGNFVELSSGNLRPCFENTTFYLYYGNFGTALAENSQIYVEIDPAFTPLSSTFPYADLGDGNYRFDLGDLTIWETGYILITGQIDCDFEVGQSICAEATITPNSKDCAPVDPLYQGGDLKVTSDCDGDSIRFRIENIGDGPSGVTGFTVIEDVVIYMESEVEIAAGEVKEFSYAANGKTLRFEMDRPEAAPFRSHPLSIEEGCIGSSGGSVSTGLVNNLSLLDDDDYFDRYCQETTAAYDPNDKQATPNGTGDNNAIYPNTRLDYRIRFQNTGSDTAFTVIIRDTLDAEVYDLASLRPGSASHEHRFSVIDGNIIEVTFANILLPDSTTNEPASNGFVNFSIDQLPDLPDGTLIENDAAIYFDFNVAIFTNVSSLEVQRRPLASKVFTYPTLGEPVSVFPSPASDYLQFEHDNWPGRTEVSVYDAYGRLLQTNVLTASGQRIDVSRLPAGRYAYRLAAEGQALQTGIVVKQ